MIKLILTDRLHRGVIVKDRVHHVISMRMLSDREVSFARQAGIRRYYLQALDEQESVDFFKRFDEFWDQVVSPFGPEHPFWRNVVSSKMQEWEQSAVHLALMLFSLTDKAENAPACIIIVCSSLEEEKVCEEWGEKADWTVYKRPSFSLPAWMRRILQEAKNLRDFLYMSGLCCYKKIFSPKQKPIKEGSILISSLSYAGSFRNGKYADPFFGNLHNFIRLNGHPVMYLCGPLGDYQVFAKKADEYSEVSVLTPHSLVTWMELIVLVSRIFFRRIRVSQVNFCGCDFSGLLMWNARRFKYPWNLDAEVSYAAVSRLCENHQFARLIQLYEGNVFERGCIQAFRQKGMGLVMGYSHGVVTRLNIKMRLSGNEKTRRPEPDVIICTGSGNKRMMTEIGSREQLGIYAGCSLRYIPVPDGAGTQPGTESDILVAFDGVRGSEVLNWLMEEAEALKDYRIKLRAHPNVSIKSLLKQCFYDMPDNFCISEEDLKTDLKNSFCVLYRQSSVGIQAILNGVPAIHLAVDSPLSGDPMEELTSFKWAVSSSSDLIAVVEEIKSLSQEQRREQLEYAEKFLKKYFAAPTQNCLKLFIQ